MYLAENKALRLITLCGLYVAQGIPWGFVTVTFAAWLATPEHGITTEQLGPMLAVATLPWSFKFLWGPLMDRFTIRSMGRRRPWIIFAQAMAVIVLGSMALIDDLPGMVWTTTPDANRFMTWIFKLVPGPLAALILVANVFVSMQDVAVDALAVDLLDESERGVANGLMYGSSYLGTAIGGAGLGLIVAKFGIRAGLLAQATFLAGIMILPILFRERRHDADAVDATIGEAPASDTPHVAEAAGLSASALQPDNPYATGTVHSIEQTVVPTEAGAFRNLAKAFSLTSTVLGALIALGTKIGIGVLTAVFVDYLMKDGGWTQEEYSNVVGGQAVMLGLGGSVVGGFLADRLGPKTMIITTSILLGLMWIGFGVNAQAIQSRTLVTGMLLAQETLLAVMTVSMFSLFMTISWPRVAATQFTTYMALSNFSTTIGSYTAGELVGFLNIHQILMVAGTLQIILLFPLLLIDPRQTRRVLGDS